MNITLNDYISIRKTIIKMLYERSRQPLKRFHFDVGSLDLHLIMPKNVLEQIYEKAVSEKKYNFLNFELSNNKQRVAVVFLADAKGITNNIKKANDVLRLSDGDTILFVLCNELKPLEQFMKTTIDNVEIFWYKQLTFNVIDHALVPKHELLEPKVKQILKPQLYIKNMNNLPTLLHTDPISKYYGMKIGDLCKITRHNPNAGEVPYYRLVVDQ